MSDNISKGKHGEKLAEVFLIENSCEIIARRFRSRYGEIDLIATRSADELHFIEVKYRTSDEYGEPFEAVDFRKRSRLKRMAEFFLLQSGSLYLRHIVHFSVVSIVAQPELPLSLEWLQIDPFSF